METLSADFLCVFQQISESRAQVPESIALSCDDRQLSYQNLYLRAEKLAGYLKQFGVTPGSAVALCMERSIEWIVAALAIMQAGRRVCAARLRMARFAVAICRGGLRRSGSGGALLTSRSARC